MNTIFLVRRLALSLLHITSENALIFANLKSAIMNHYFKKNSKFMFQIFSELKEKGSKSANFIFKVKGWRKERKMQKVWEDGRRHRLWGSRADITRKNRLKIDRRRSMQSKVTTCRQIKLHHILLKLFALWNSEWYEPVHPSSIVWKHLEGHRD